MIKYVLLFGILLLVACTAAPEVTTNNTAAEPEVPVIETTPVENTVVIAPEVEDEVLVVENISNDPVLDLSQDPPLSTWCVPGQAFTFSPTEGVVDRGFVQGNATYKSLEFCQAEAYRLDESGTNSTYYFTYGGKYMYVLVTSSQGYEETFVEN